MKNIIYIIIVSIIYCSPLLGYGGPPPPPPFYNAETNNAVFQPPINLGEKSQTTLFVHFAYTAVPDISGRINLEGTGTEPAGLVNGRNFEWSIPKVNFRVGIFPSLSKNTSLLLSLNGNAAGGNLKVNGLNIGLSFNITRSSNHYARLGFGLDFRNNCFYWVQSPYAPAKECRNFESDPYILLAYNTAFKDWIFNPFMEISYCKQTLMDDDEYSRPDYDQEVYFNMNVWTFTPGLSYRWGSNKLISFGAMLYHYDGIESSRKFILMPFIQMGLLL
jgi:hypothetical protein